MTELRKKLKGYSGIIYSIYMVLLGVLVSGGFYSGDRAYKVVFVICAGLWLVKMALTDFKLKELILILFVFFLLGMTFITNGEKTLIITAMGITGAKDTDLDKTLLWVLIGKAVATIELGILVACGLVSNTMLSNVKGDVVSNNPCMGFSHPNRAFLNLLMMAFLVVLIWKEKIKWYGYLLLTAGLLLGYKVFYCRTGIIVWLAFLLLLLLYRLSVRVKLARIYLYLFTLIPLLLAAFTFIMVELGKRGSALATKADKLLHNRLLIITKYPVRGLNLWGSDRARAFDNGLYHLLYNYGYIITLLLLVAYIIAVFVMIRQKKEYELLILGASLIVIFMEYAAWSINWNYALVFLSLALFSDKNTLWGGRNVSKSN